MADKHISDVAIMLCERLCVACGTFLDTSADTAHSSHRCDGSCSRLRSRVTTSHTLQGATIQVELLGVAGLLVPLIDALPHIVGWSITNTHNAQYLLHVALTFTFGDTITPLDKLMQDLKAMEPHATSNWDINDTMATIPSPYPLPQNMTELCNTSPNESARICDTLNDILFGKRDLESMPEAMKYILWNQDVPEAQGRASFIVYGADMLTNGMLTRLARRGWSYNSPVKIRLCKAQHTCDTDEFVSHMTVYIPHEISQLVRTAANQIPLSIVNVDPQPSLLTRVIRAIYDSGVAKTMANVRDTVFRPNKGRAARKHRPY